MLYLKHQCTVKLVYSNEKKNKLQKAEISYWKLKHYPETVIIEGTAAWTNK